MELRFLVFCDKDGVKSDPILQYKDLQDSQFEWENVPVVEKIESEEEI